MSIKADPMHYIVCGLTSYRIGLMSLLVPYPVATLFLNDYLSVAEGLS